MPPEDDVGDQKGTNPIAIRYPDQNNNCTPKKADRNAKNYKMYKKNPLVTIV
jgi:hypothetical protein